MSDIGLILNLLLGALLILALALGWRLERRLKALRDSHQSFTRAVDDLDRAAARAEQGLADLRAATDEAAETLAGRIDRAKTLAVNLEKLTTEAVSAEQRLTAAPRPANTRESILARFSERYGEARPTPAAPVQDLRTDLILEDAAPPRAANVTRIDAGRPAPLDRAAEGARSRARIDDDLFDEPASRAAGLRGAR
ncbi:MAG: DUF6468 domain-containing protein [Caulobacterales bacterium]